MHSLVTGEPDYVTRHHAYAGVPTWPMLLELNRSSEKRWERKHVAKASPLVCYYLKRDLPTTVPHIIVQLVISWQRKA